MSAKYSVKEKSVERATGVQSGEVNFKLSATELSEHCIVQALVRRMNRLLRRLRVHF